MDPKKKAIWTKKNNVFKSVNLPYNKSAFNFVSLFLWLNSNSISVWLQQQQNPEGKKNYRLSHIICLWKILLAVSLIRQLILFDTYWLLLLFLYFALANVSDCRALAVKKGRLPKDVVHQLCRMPHSNASAYTLCSVSSCSDWII